MECALSWQPIWRVIETTAQKGQRLSWVVSPFIKLDALKRLLDSVEETNNLLVIARWRIEDFTAGVSDLEIFPYLQSRGIKLYANYSLHMKLYVFSSNTAVSTSGNLTLRGLGYVDQCNIEVANEVSLLGGDWVRLHELVQQSRLVTAEVYDRYKEVLASIPVHQPIPSKGFDELFGPRKEFTLGALPATAHPEMLIDFLFDQSQHLKGDPEFLRRAYHDLAIYRVEDLASTRDELITRLRSNFCGNTFVQAFLANLRECGSIHFGGVTSWIHSNCDDVPLPYRWEVKVVTRCLYNWLEYFVDEVTWDRPNHSQVIRWNSLLRDQTGLTKSL
jgi:hypothetical protein